MLSLIVMLRSLISFNVCTLLFTHYYFNLGLLFFDDYEYLLILDPSKYHFISKVADIIHKQSQTDIVRIMDSINHNTNPLFP